MTDCVLTLDFGHGAETPLSGTVKVGRYTPADNGTMWVTSIRQAITMAPGPFVTCHVQQGVYYWFEEPDGSDHLKLIPTASTANYRQLADIDPTTMAPTVPPGPAFQAAVNAEIANRTTAVAAKKDDPFRFDLTRGRAFKAALGKRASAPVDVLGIGASWIAGSGAGAPPTGRWFDDAMTGLRAKWQPAGVAGGLGYRESNSTTSGWVTPFTYTGTTLPQTTIGLGRKVVRIALNGTVSFVSPGTSVDVLYGKSPTAGNFTWKIGAGSATTVNANSVTVSDGVLRIVTSPGDTITLTSAQAGGFFYFEGVMFYNGDETKGFRFWSGATSGYRTTDFLDVSGTTYGAWGVVDPDLVIIGDLIANDFGGGTAGVPVPVATSQANLTTLFAAIRAKCTRPPTMVLLELPEITAAAPVAPWSDYRQMMSDFARGDGNTVLWDVAPIFGTMLNPDSYGIGAGDQAHPNLAGHQMVADSLLDVLAQAS